MIKIGIDIRNIGKKRTGDEAVFFNLVKNLALIDSENEYFLFTDITDTLILQSIGVDLGVAVKNNFKIISLKTFNKFTWNFWTLPMYLRHNPIDIYQTQYITPFFVPKKIKIITIIHDISFNFFPKLIKFPDLLFLKIFIPISLKRADKILGVSKFTRNEIIDFYKVDPGKVDWIYNAVGDNFFEKITKEHLEAVREKYNLPEKFILYLGTLQPRKNIASLVKAFAGIKEKVPEAKLVLAGNQKGANFDKKIDTAIKKNNLENSVIFSGFIDEKDKPAIFRLATVFCYPSLYEGFGIPILEAMSQGTPVLVSDIPSLREVAKDSALFFDVEDIADFQKKLYTIFIDKNLRETLVNFGLERVQIFSWKESAEKISEIYDNLLK
jgi:glycosyltransferase involved in cell wall biosynthesis